MKVTLTTIGVDVTKGPEGVTETVVGYAAELPTIGLSFVMITKNLANPDPNEMRVIVTDPVTAIHPRSAQSLMFQVGTLFPLYEITLNDRRPADPDFVPRLVPTPSGQV